MTLIKSTKKFDRMPCAHAQYFDVNQDGTPGPCAGLHGYSRSVKLEFSGSIDQHGWLVPFGELKAVRKWLEYYFDHTAILGADDPRLSEYQKMSSIGMIVLRSLPYGVSMEMSSLFIFEHVNRYIYKVTRGRCYITKVECIEHDPNSAVLEISDTDSIRQASDPMNTSDDLLPMKQYWTFETPRNAIDRLLGNQQ